MGRECFQHALYNLTNIPSLWRDMRAGMVGRLLRLKCDEEISHYLHHIYRAWSKVMDGNLAHMAKVDLRTIRALEARSPAYSFTDAACLERRIRIGELFASFSEPEREQIWIRLQAFPGTIPSFTTFFEDLKYLEAIADCLKSLVRPPYRQSVRQGFCAAFDQSSAIIDDDGRQTNFLSAYRQVFVFAMRHLEELRPGSVLLEQGERRHPVLKDPRAWHEYATLANQLGFQSTQISQLIADNPDQLVAQQALLNARRSEVFQFDDKSFNKSVSQIMAAFTSAQKIETAPGDPMLTTNAAGESLRRRTGSPYRQSYLESAPFLSLKNLHSTSADSLGEPTPFFVRQQFYFACLAHMDSQQPDLSPTMVPPLSTGSELIHLARPRPEEEILRNVPPPDPPARATAPEDEVRQPSGAEGQSSPMPSSRYSIVGDEITVSSRDCSTLG